MLELIIGILMVYLGIQLVSVAIQGGLKLLLLILGIPLALIGVHLILMYFTK
jgi:hypothetical protein